MKVRTRRSRYETRMPPQVNGYSSIGRFPILKQDKHVRKRPEFTASGNAGRKISRGFRAISRGFAKQPQEANVSHSKKLRAQTFWRVFRNSLIFQTGYVQNVRKFAVEGREITPRPMETL